MFNIPNNTKPSLSLNPTNTTNTGFNNQNTQQAVGGQPFAQPMNNNQNYTQNIQQPVNNNQNYTQNMQQPVNNNQNFIQNMQQPINNNQNYGQNQQQPVFNTQPQVSQNNYGMNNSSGSQGGGVILSKGQKVSLSKFNSALDEIDVCLGWDVSAQNCDLDSEAFMLGANDKVIGDDWFVFYNQTCSPDGSVRHSGDNRTGQGYGDDEIISIKLSKVNPSVSKIVFVVTINEAKERNLNFAGVSNAFIRVVDKSQNRELVRFNLTEYYSNVTSMMVGEIYKKNNEWRFNPIGNGTDDDLFGLCRRYGVNVAG